MELSKVWLWEVAAGSSLRKYVNTQMSSRQHPSCRWTLVPFKPVYLKGVISATKKPWLQTHPSTATWPPGCVRNMSGQMFKQVLGCGADICRVRPRRMPNTTRALHMVSDAAPVPTRRLRVLVSHLHSSHVCLGMARYVVKASAWTCSQSRSDGEGVEGSL